MNIKGQGALEYLLILAGAVLIAAIVLSLLAGTADTTGGDVIQNTEAARCAPFDESICEVPAYSDFADAGGAKDGFSNCHWDSSVGDAGRCLPGAP